MGIFKKILSKEDRTSEAAEPSNASVLKAAGLHAMGDFNANDVFIAGYPKSGNTWMQYLVAGVVFGVDVRFSPDTVVQELVPDVHFKQYFRRYLDAAYFKSHALPDPSYRKVIYVVRDGRDAMVSYYQYHRNKANGPNVDFLEMVQKGTALFPCKWHEHVEQWMANPHGAEMMLLRYEDLKKDTVGELKRICSFIGVERSADVLERAATNASFSVMKDRQKTIAWENPKVPRDQFVRRGQVGSYKDEMPPNVLDAFLREARPALEKVGYSL